MKHCFVILPNFLILLFHMWNDSSIVNPVYTIRILNLGSGTVRNQKQVRTGMSESGNLAQRNFIVTPYFQNSFVITLVNLVFLNSYRTVACFLHPTAE
jgi:hypothetical protein